MLGVPKVETFRWRTVTRHVFGAEVDAKDPDGSVRAVVEGGWLAVVYSRDGSFDAFVEMLDRARANRRYVHIAAGNASVTVVAEVTLETSVGRFEWRSGRLEDEPQYYGPDIRNAAPTVARGEMTLPDGKRRKTSAGTGLFDLPGYARAYRPWRDADLHGGWDLVTEVDESAPDEWQPILAAFPLLLFTTPPHSY